ncbi:MAG: PilZ domain-containing protein [Deltaproteobacteria bacterium]|nr:PilZ domain-containing protein [Deltaproteobacteria bacterium]MBW2122301.1 PilZ domain-containing protein [Deltaproteobacteria bacterium]
MIDQKGTGFEHRVCERRKHRRYFGDIPFDCWPLKQGKRGPSQVGIAENAGAGGLCIHLEERIPEGNEIILELYYRDDHRFSSLKLLAVVIWNSEEREARGYRHGLKLLRLETGGGRKLQSLLKQCLALM